MVMIFEEKVMRVICVMGSRREDQTTRKTGFKIKVHASWIYKILVKWFFLWETLRDMSGEN